MNFIDLQTQYRRYQKDITDRMQKVLNSAQFILGPEVAELESSLAQYVGVKHCLTVASGTDSLAARMRGAEERHDQALMRLLAARAGVGQAPGRPWRPG